MKSEFGSIPDTAELDAGRDASGDCFLCAPDSALVYLSGPNGVALCGLGPLTAGYTVVGAKSHVRSSADALVAGSNFVDFAMHVRAFLIERFGGCLMTEHGRMPVCHGAAGAAERHCFHAHFLLFPAAPSILGLAVPYFAAVTQHTDLRSVLRETARTNQEYFLVSPTPHQVFVMQRPNRMMRQFSRCLVAAALGRPGDADWQAKPDVELAREYARDLRLALQGSGE